MTVNHCYINQDVYCSALMSCRRIACEIRNRWNNWKAELFWTGLSHRGSFKDICKNKTTGNHSLTTNTFMKTITHLIPTLDNVPQCIHAWAAPQCIHALAAPQCIHALVAPQCIHALSCKTHSCTFWCIFTHWIFQHLISQVLSEVLKTLLYMDAVILLTKHMMNMEDVLEFYAKLWKAPVSKIKEATSQYFTSIVVYFWSVFSSDEAQPIPRKVLDITEAPCPSNMK